MASPAGLDIEFTGLRSSLSHPEQIRYRSGCPGAEEEAPSPVPPLGDTLASRQQCLSAGPPHVGTGRAGRGGWESGDRASACYMPILSPRRDRNVREVSPGTSLGAVSLAWAMRCLFLSSLFDLPSEWYLKTRQSVQQFTICQIGEFHPQLFATGC